MAGEAAGVAPSLAVAADWVDFIALDPPGQISIGYRGLVLTRASPGASTCSVSPVVRDLAALYPGGYMREGGL